MSSSIDLQSDQLLDEFLKVERLIVLHFWTTWSEPCHQVNDALDDLASNYAQLMIIKIEAESHSGISLKYEVIAVPTIIFIKDTKVVDRVDGAHIPEITHKIHALCVNSLFSGNTSKNLPNQNSPEVEKSVGILPAVEESVGFSPANLINQKIESLTSCSHVVLFMKGTPDSPKCGFSRSMCTILKDLNVQFFSFDILTDENIRQGLKKYSKWPTFPQLYVKKNFIGGLDIVKELNDSGELLPILTADMH